MQREGCRYDCQLKRSCKQSDASAQIVMFQGHQSFLRNSESDQYKNGTGFLSETQRYFHQKEIFPKISPRRPRGDFRQSVPERETALAVS